MLSRALTSGSRSFREDEASVLDLEEIPPTQADHLSAIYRHRSPVELPLPVSGMKIQASWATPHADDVPAPWTIAFHLSGQEFELIVPERLLNSILAQVDPALSLSTLSPDLRALLFEFALDTALEAVERVGNCTLSITSMTSGFRPRVDDARTSVHLRMQIEGAPMSSCRLFLGPDGLHHLARALDMFASERRTSRELPFSAHLCWGSVELTLAELRSLRPGDIVLADDCCSQPGLAIAVIGGHLAAPAELLPSGYRLIHDPVRVAGSPFEWCQRLRRSYPDTATAQDLPVRVLFELGALVLDRSAVQGLTAGSVLGLARPLEQGLDIVVNGARIGRGELTNIGGAAGVRVTR